jgi:hypothetical protein
MKPVQTGHESHVLRLVRFDPAECRLRASELGGHRLLTDAAQHAGLAKLAQDPRGQKPATPSSALKLGLAGCHLTMMASCAHSPICVDLPSGYPPRA